MQFKIGDRVFHPIHGIGKIVAIKELALNGDEPCPYYEVKIKKTVIWSQVDPEGSGRLRPITPKSELGTYLALLKSRPLPLKDNYRARQIDLLNRFKSGSFQARCEIVRDLSARKQVRDLSDFDSNLLSKASDHLFEEVAAIKGVSRSEAVRGVEALLAEGQGSR